MKNIVLSALLLVGSAWAQIPTFPQLVQSCVSSGTTCVFPQNVTSGNLLWVSMHDETNSSAPSISDSRSTSYSLIDSSDNTCGWLYDWYGTAGGSGANTITLGASGSFRDFHAMEFANATGTLDVHAVKHWSSLTTITSDSVTTADNGELIVSLAHSCNSGGFDTLNPLQFVGQGPTADSAASGFKVAGLAGSYSTSFNWGGGSSGHVNIATFKAASSLTVVTNTLPDASTSQAYSIQLESVGGAGSITWSLTTGNLPCGLSLSSGGIISGTPTCGPNNTFTVQASDGTHTATKNLSIHTGTSVSTAAIVQASVLGDCNGTHNLSSTVTAGNLLFVQTAVVNPTGPSVVSANLSTNLFRYPVISDSHGSSETGVYSYIGTIGSSGTLTVTCGSSTAEFIAYELSGLQFTYDSRVLVWSQLLTGSSPLSSGSLTVPMANSLLLAYVLDDTASGTTLSFQSPLSNYTANTAGGISGEYGKYLDTGTGSQNASFTTTQTGHDHQIVLLGFPPSVAGSAPTGHIRHSAQSN